MDNKNQQQRPKTIAIDARFYQDAGPGRYVKNIISALEKVDIYNNYLVFLRPRGYELYIPKNPRFKKVIADVPWYSFAEQTIFLFDLLKRKMDILYVPHFNIPVLYPFKIVSAIPDIIMHTFSTEKGTTLPKWYFKLKKFVYKRVVEWTVIRSQKVIVPTEDVKRDMIKHFKWANPNKFIIAAEGVDPDYLKTDIADTNILKEFNIKKPFLLYVSSMYEHKNVINLIKAFQILKATNKFEGNLILIGRKDKFAERVLDEIKKLNLSNDVIMPGMKRYITDEDVITLRKNAALYTFPSLKEGFSLTPLEAQAVGLVSVISDIPCHKEVFGDSVVYFDPLNPEDIAENISSTLHNKELMDDLRIKGFEQVKKYDWIKAGEITVEIFNSIKI